MGAIAANESPQQIARLTLPQRVSLMLLRRREQLTAPAGAIADAAAIAVGNPSLEQLAAVAQVDRPTAVAALVEAQQRGLMRANECRHDLVRQALRDAIPAAHALELHRRTAQHLAGEGAEPEIVAHHWRCAGDDEAAWPYVLCTAQQMKLRGERSRAASAMVAVRDGARDVALALRAEVMLAQEHLFDDLPAGRRLLESTLVRAGCLPPGAARRMIEAQALSGLVDNAVFSGDQRRALALAVRLRARLQGLGSEGLIEAHQALIEATMRAGEFEAARASLDSLRKARAPEAVVLSFEAQIHWFSGAVREARQVFERLLARHADYCTGLTIENDLAVMCHALGDLGAAEEMARRSLQSWRGVAHTEALSSLVLGSTLTSAGRFDEAADILRRARDLGQGQGSALFVAEALARTSRMHWCAGESCQARATALEARARAGEVREPLRASGLALAEALSADSVAGLRSSVAVLGAICRRSRHPVVLVRRCRAQVALALAGGDRIGALRAARQLCAIARDAGLLEWLCEGLALVGELDDGRAGQTARQEALTIANSSGYGWIAA